MYLLLEKNLKDKDSFTISLDEFKETFKIENKYERYFDIKMKIISPALKDINSSLKSSYKAIELRKDTSSKSPVIGIKFIKRNKRNIFEKDLLERLNKKISKKDFFEKQTYFWNFVEKNHYEMLVRSINFV